MSQARRLEAIIGRELMDRVCAEFGGERVYIPTSPPHRREEIVVTFNHTIGDAPSVMTAYEEVADVTGYSVRTVQRAVGAG